MTLKKLKAEDKLAAQLERIIEEARAALREYRAAGTRGYRRRPVILKDPRNGQTIKKGGKSWARINANLES